MLFCVFFFCLFEVRYQGCGTEVRVPASRFDNDMSLYPQLPATLFNAPKLRWRSDPGEMFTMVFVDSGFNCLHQNLPFSIFEVKL